MIRDARASSRGAPRFIQRTSCIPFPPVCAILTRVGRRSCVGSPGVEGRDRNRPNAGGLLVGGLATLVARGALAASASAKKGKGKSAVTTSASTAIAPGIQQVATANCAKKTHVTGGGWSVSPTYSAN